jgi:pimeloyl-ACP methyl ester carboxylesterase
MNSKYAICEGREIHYTEWGAGNRETLIAWHGLARTGRDMDDIAAHLAPRYRVICPDTIGRGLRRNTASSSTPGSRSRSPTGSAWSAFTGSAPRWAARSASGSPPAR